MSDTDCMILVEGTQRNKEERDNKGQSYSLVSGVPNESIDSNTWIMHHWSSVLCTLKQAASIP